MLRFTPEVALKAIGSGVRLYTIWPVRTETAEDLKFTLEFTLEIEHETNHAIKRPGGGTSLTSYTVILCEGLPPDHQEPKQATAPTLHDAMQQCIAHEQKVTKAPTPRALAFTPSVYFHADGNHEHRYSIHYEGGVWVGDTSYEYPAWVKVNRSSEPLGTWGTLGDAMTGCNEEAARRRDLDLDGETLSPGLPMGQRWDESSDRRSYHESRCHDSIHQRGAIMTLRPSHEGSADCPRMSGKTAELPRPTMSRLRSGSQPRPTGFSSSSPTRSASPKRPSFAS